MLYMSQREDLSPLPRHNTIRENLRAGSSAVCSGSESESVSESDRAVPENLA